MKENFLEKVFLGSGNLAINTAGTSQEEIVLKHIANPYDVKKKIEEIKSLMKYR